MSIIPVLWQMQINQRKMIELAEERWGTGIYGHLDPKIIKRKK